MKFLSKEADSVISGTLSQTGYPGHYGRRNAIEEQAEENAPETSYKMTIE